MGIYEITDFGAVGDGKAKNTECIQAAIDKCNKNGGGKVVVPPGTFVTGTIWLKDNVNLHLTHGAVLLGSPDIEDYNADDSFVQNYASKLEKASGGHLIIALEVENIAISGSGSVDGNSSAFIDFSKSGQERNKIIPNKRPGQMIYFCECKNIKVKDISLNNSPYWTLFIHGCEAVGLKSINLQNPHQTPNGDGIDIDCSRNVIVSDCKISSGDDCITLRGNNLRLKNKDCKCENIVINNCILKSAACGIRVGVGAGHVRNCRVSNCIIRNSRTGINFISKYLKNPGPGTSIENIYFSNINITNVTVPIWMQYGNECSDTIIKNIHFNDIDISSESGSYISGVTETNIISNIFFRNINILMKKPKSLIFDKDIPYSNNLREWDLRLLKKHIYTRLPYVFYISNAKKIKFKDLNIIFEDLKAEYKNIFLLDVSEISASNIEVDNNLDIDPNFLIKRI